MHLLALPAQAVRRARQLGPLGALRLLVDKLCWRLFETRWGLVTSASIDGRDLGLGGDQYGYQPIDHRSLQLALEALDVRQDDVFVDLGCGMGRAVLLAARRPFRRVLGVEYSPSLVQVARRNVRRAKRWLCCPHVEIIQADAALYEMPSDVSVVFMFNPFGGRVLNRVLDQIAASLANRPRPLTVIYSLPKENHDAVAQRIWLQTAEPIETPHAPWQRMTVYRHTPTLEGAS